MCVLEGSFETEVFFISLPCFSIALTSFIFSANIVPNSVSSRSSSEMFIKRTLSSPLVISFLRTLDCIKCRSDRIRQLSDRILTAST